MCIRDRVSTQSTGEPHTTTMASCRLFLLLVLVTLIDVRAAKVNRGTVDAVYALLDRVLPAGAAQHFDLNLQDGQCAPGVAPPCFALADNANATISIRGSSASELTAGVGVYLREYCNMTVGWPRGGGSNVFVPAVWPVVGSAVAQRRNTPWSYIMNVCTHSYSLVWYSWSDWERFLDWMALSGLNLYLAMTGQEEVQYKVFQKFGLTDQQIRYWFNGPAFLTWSRGQNEYGAKIAGPLPRSWMKGQWSLQQQIVARHRSLGMYGQLPGFQGNVPIALKQVTGDANITTADATGWMNSVDPLYAKIADAWMQQLVADFGTDSWYQLDGYFNGGTAPWAVEAPNECTWSTLAPNSYLAGCVSKCTPVVDLGQAKAQCAANALCGGLTSSSADGPWQLRSASALQPSPSAECSYSITNTAACHAVPDDPSWTARGAAAYQGLNRTDPDAIWSFQGWAFVGWSTAQQASSLRSFIDATPTGKFNVIDMSVNGDGEWKKWSNSSFWGANFIWTTLHDFGGTDGLKGWLDRINDIPFGAQEVGASVWGTGTTPEGIDQNPVYYEFMLQSNFRDKRVSDLPAHIVTRAHKRYGLVQEVDAVRDAWMLLVNSSYAQDLSVQDGTGVPHLGGAEAWAFAADRHTPSSTMCSVYKAWSRLIDATDHVSCDLEPFRYDLVNTGREVLAQLAGPAGQNFSDATKAASLDDAALKGTGQLYTQVLLDLDVLVSTDPAFLLGPWIASAKLFAGNNTDCTDTGYASITSCTAFYEWNARVQLTTWNPTQQGAAKIPGGPIDYASKHWSGLIKDYYAARVTLLQSLALSDAAAGRALDSTAWDRLQAELAYNWTTATNAYTEVPVGDPVAVSKEMRSKYEHFFSSCA
eukprot:TRINITY_DN5245_c0_g1_i1.p1 TRINITY_DN5245_c0_g1~~TRINITY_DN5245_c0_g1_i1.p1  ORF type:complete len:881 (+),score=212.00 TRINITY_DN5245_c0_g1_i1:28-2643(+)